MPSNSIVITRTLLQVVALSIPAVAIVTRALLKLSQSDSLKLAGVSTEYRKRGIRLSFISISSLVLSSLFLIIHLLLDGIYQININWPLFAGVVFLLFGVISLSYLLYSIHKVNIAVSNQTSTRLFELADAVEAVSPLEEISEQRLEELVGEEVIEELKEQTN